MKHRHIFKTILPALLLLAAVAGGNGAWAQSHPSIGSIIYDNSRGAYAITNVNNLKDLSVYVNGMGTYTTGGTETTPHDCSGLTFKQTGNIICNSIDTIRTIGTYSNSNTFGGSDPIPFKGTYDGQGYIIEALKVKNDRYDKLVYQVYFCGGMFGVIADGAVLQNIRLVNPSINNVISLEDVYLATHGGGAKNSRVTIDKWWQEFRNVYYYMAGIVGEANSSTIQNCYVFNPVFSYSSDDNMFFEMDGASTFPIIHKYESAICSVTESTTVTGSSEVFLVREGSGVSITDNSVPSNVGFTYSGSRFYKQGSTIGIQYVQTRIGYNLGFTDGEGNNIPYSGSSPNYTLTTINRNSLITPIFTPITYQLSYDNIDDATFITPNPDTYNIETETFTLKRPSREGYTFLGWVGTDLPRVTKEVTINRGSIGDRQYTAQWIEGVEPIFEVTNQGGIFTIKRDVTTAEQTVYYRTVSLTAIAGQHFNQTSGTVTFAVGDSVKVITVTERTPSGDAYKYQNGTSRTYRFEVLDEGGFELVHKDRTITTGTNVPSSGVFDIKNVTIQTSAYTADDRGYDNNGYKSVGASSYCNSGTQAYLGFLNAQLRMTLSFDAKENDDAYEYLQILFDNTSTCDNRSSAGNGNPGTPNLSRYMAGFEMNTGSKDDSYKSYTFPVTSVGNASATNPWGHGTAYPLTNQKFKDGFRATDGRLIVPTDFSTIVLRLNASGSSGSDEWAVKNVKAHIQAVDATAPTKQAASVNPGPHAQGNIAYVSVSFNEIVTVTGSTPYLNTSWGNLKYIAGSGTNVLTFADTITATEGTRLQITSCARYNNIKDLAGNSLSSSFNHVFASGDVVTATHDYNITYTLNGGTATPANPATYNYSTPTFTLTNPARAGYTFNGWTGSDLTEASMSVTVATHSHGDKRFIANWSSPIIYSIDYDLADGSLETPNPESYTVESDDIILVNPTRDNYIFIGWTGTDLASPTISVTIAQCSTGDRSYTANWHPLWGIALGADGSVEHPYQIAATLDLDSLAARVNRGTDYSGIYFLQTADITYDGTANNYTPVGRLEANSFGGSYDGGGYTISGININANASSDNNFGLFGRIAATATVQRITLASTTITARSNVGGIVGVNGGGAVQDCRVESTVTINAGTANYAYNHGGVVGSNLYGGTICGCLSAATVSRQKNSDNARYGGIVGNNDDNPIVANCLFIGPTPTCIGSVGSIAGLKYTTTTIANNYYTVSTLGGVNEADINGARKAHIVTLGTDISLVGTETVYTVSGLTAIGTKALRLSDGTIYSGATQTLTLSYNGDIPTGYHVVFSYNDGSDHTLASNSLTMPDADITVSSSIEATTYTISYDLAGGSVATPNPTSYTVESDITLVNPTREGYDFTGWTGTGLAEPTMSVTIADSTGDRSYTATWTPHIYAINYNLNGGSADNPTSYTIETPTFTLNNPTRTGYTFAGWAGDGSGMSVTITHGTTEDLNYEAEWTENTYTIHFEANVSGGIPVMPVNPNSTDITDILYSSQFNLPPADSVFTRTGYYLDRWTTEPNGSGTAYADSAEVSMLTAEQGGTVTLYAQWEVIDWTGFGNEYIPYIITYASQLVEIADNVNHGVTFRDRYFKLGNDIDMGDVGDFTPIGLGTFGNSITCFHGHFDGDGKTIRNLTVYRPDDARNGLFGYVEDGSVRNVVIDNANVTGAASTGCVVGTLYNGTVSHCIVKNSTVTATSGWSSTSAIVGGFSFGYIDSNYYHNCVRIYNGDTASVNIGVNGADRDGARSVHSLTLPAHVTASSDETVVIDDETYYASNVDVTLNYTDLPRHFNVNYSYNDGSDHALAGNSFTMPAADVTVSASISPDLATWWHADENHDGTTEARAYIITDTTGLNLLATLVKGVDGYPGNEFQGQYFKLGNDIIYNHTTDWDDATSTENNYTPIAQHSVVDGQHIFKYFRGTFDGDHHTIRGIRIYRNGNTINDGTLGIFGETDNAAVKNVTLSDARITGRSNVGGIVGALTGTAENCHVTNSVAIHAVADDAIYHGGVVGSANGGTIIGCSSAATLTVANGLTGCENYGGIVGYGNCVIQDCFVYGITIPVLHAGQYNQYDASGAIVGMCDRVSSFRNNYYYGVTIGGATTGIGIGHEKDATDSRHDVTTNDAAVPIYSVTLGEHVTATPATTMAFDNKVCYKTGTDVTLQSEGCIITGPYTVTDAQGNNIAVSGGNVFTMPDYDVTANASLMSGSGTEQDPYIISTPEELVALSDYTNNGHSTSGMYFLMANDIDMSGVANFAPIGRYTSNNDYHPFGGIFDGGNHTIKHLTIDDAAGLTTGLFGETNNAAVKFLTLDSASIRGAHDVGGIVGHITGYSNPDISSCRVNNSSFYTEENAHLGAIVCKYSNITTMYQNYYYNCSVNGSYVPTGIGTSDGDKNASPFPFAMPITDLTFEVEAGQWQAIAKPFSDDDYFPFSTDLTEGVYDLLYYDEYQARWIDCRNDTNFRFENRFGYIYRSATSGTRTMQGVPQRAEAVAGGSNAIQLDVSKYCDDAAFRGFNLLGNPNDAPIVLQDAETGLAGYYTLTPDGTWQPHLLSDTIAVGQAFLVQANEYGSISIQVQPIESKGVIEPESQSALRFEVSNGRHSDIAYATIDGATQSLHKFGHMEEGLPTLSIVRGDERYAIAAIGDSTQAFNMAFSGQPGSYTISMGLIGDMGTVDYCHLVDKVAGRDIDLLRDSTYTFKVESGEWRVESGNRFLVKLSPNGGVESGKWRAENFARWDGDKLIVTGEGTLQVFDMMGRQLFTREANSSLIIHHSSFPSTGVYMLRLGGQSQKIVIR